MTAALCRIARPEAVTSDATRPCLTAGGGVKDPAGDPWSIGTRQSS
jgi:hypothetical protein